MRIAIAGGTGTVGSHVSRIAAERGHEVVVLARSRGMDFLTGAGLTKALEGVDCVIDVSNITTLSAVTATQFFVAVTGNLETAETEAGVGHHVLLSVAGIDAIDSSYYAGKLAQEHAVRAARTPHTIVRTAQFHEFAEQVVRQTSFAGLALVPRTLTRPVAARDVARRLVNSAEAGPRESLPDLVGPKDDTLISMVRRMFEFDGASRKAIELRLPGRYARGLASGSLRGSADREQSALTFNKWLTTPDHTRID